MEMSDGLPAELPPDFSIPNSAEGWVEAFLRLAPKDPWGITGHAYFEPPMSRASRTEHLVISFAVHGNEWGTLPAAVCLLWGLLTGKIVFRGPVSLLLGNIEAVAQDVRFVQEDYNRVFTFDRPAETLERKRADEVKPLLDRADFFFDLHQTQTPTASAFWTFPWSNELGLWARAIGAAPRGLVRAQGGAFSSGKKCLDEYVRDRGKLGITAELGEKGPDASQARAAYASVVRLITAYDSVCLAERSLVAWAEVQPAVDWFETVDVVAPPAEDARLRPGLGCFSEVEQGEIVSAAGAPLIQARERGYVMFPKYQALGEPAPPELYRLAVPVTDPRVRYAS
jgi:succinylglutamate desuccinylase